MAAVDVGVHIETADARQRRQTRAESRHQHDAAYGSGADGAQIMQQADGAKAVRDEQGVVVGRTDGLRQRRLPGGKIGMLAVGHGRNGGRDARRLQTRLQPGKPMVSGARAVAVDDVSVHGMLLCE